MLVETHASAVSAGTELAVYTGTHQWLQGPEPAGLEVPVSARATARRARSWRSARRSAGWKPGDRVSYPGQPRLARAADASATSAAGVEAAGQPRLREGGLGLHRPLRHGRQSIRAGLTLGRSAAVLGLGIIGQFALRCLLAAGAHPVVGIDAVQMRRDAALAAGADHVIDPSGRRRARAARPSSSAARGAEIVADATGVPDAIPVAMSPGLRRAGRWSSSAARAARRRT